jgi:hypothetical protein
MNFRMEARLTDYCLVTQMELAALHLSLPPPSQDSCSFSTTNGVLDLSCRHQKLHDFLRLQESFNFDPALCENE